MMLGFLRRKRTSHPKASIGDYVLVSINGQSTWVLVEEMGWRWITVRIRSAPLPRGYARNDRAVLSRRRHPPIMVVPARDVPAQIMQDFVNLPIERDEVFDDEWSSITAKDDAKLRLMNAIHNSRPVMILNDDTATYRTDDFGNTYQVAE